MPPRETNKHMRLAIIYNIEYVKCTALSHFGTKGEVPNKLTSPG